MQSGSVTEQPIVELFGSLVAQRASGRLDIVQDKRKRAFWFENGQLSFSKSNLRSETQERIAERNPDIPPERLPWAQLKLRLRNVAALQEGDWTFKPNVAPPKRDPQPLLKALTELVLTRVPEAVVDARLAGLGSRYPRLGVGGPTPRDLGLDDPGLEMLSTLDGGRPLEDVLEFAPMDPVRARKIIYLAVVTGAVNFEEDEATLARVSAAPEALPTVAEKAPFSEVGAPSNLADLFDAPIVSAPTGGAAMPVEIAQDPASAPLPVLQEHPELPALRQELRRVEDAEDHFGVLEVHWDADENTFRKAYFALAQRLHPDRWTDAPQEVRQLAADIFAKVSEAWEELGDAEARKAYTDRVIHGIKSEDELAMEKVRAILAAEDDFKAGLSQFRRGNLVGAHELFEKAHLAVPEEAEFQAYFGYTLFKQHYGKNEAEAQRGVNLIKSAIDNHVKLDGGWVLMGLVFRSANNHKRAISAFRKALEMNPANVDAERELRRSAQEMRRAAEKAAKEEKKGFFGRFFKK
ncbi:MAG: DnaJ domain-containing protein [Myxococcota bacterium]|nr:DnaJ domain-containing protein [Myxococcota bacterium]